MKTVAIACQGGGSHTAFSAGVLQTLLRRIDSERYRIIGLSGTSGGALCAVIAWCGLLLGDPERGAQLLDSFWREVAAREPWDALANDTLVWLTRMRESVALPEISPYQVPPTGQDYLAELLKRHIPFADLPGLVNADSPEMLVGAVNALSGGFTVFRSRHRDPEKRISVDALLASAAIPSLFRAVRIGKSVYWDGLFSENPPIRGFLAGHASAAAKPDEIWIVQINPDHRSEEPKSMKDIDDRRNELAGNLSLNQEIFFVRQANDWLQKGWLSASHFKHVELRRIELDMELDYASKLDRNPDFIGRMIDHGNDKAAQFLRSLNDHR